MLKATALKPFEDLADGVLRKAGDSFTVKDERGEYLASIGLVKTEKTAEKPKKKATKKGEE